MLIPITTSRQMYCDMHKKIRPGLSGMCIKEVKSGISQKEDEPSYLYKKRHGLYIHKLTEYLK